MAAVRRRWRRLLAGLAVVLLGSGVGLVLVIAAMFYVEQRQIVFRPLGAEAAGRAEDAGMTAITITAADGVGVVHWYAPAAPGRPVVVLFHGNAGAIGDLGPWADALRARDYGAVLADYRGYSGNPGAPSEAGVYADGRALLAWLNAQGVDDRHIVLLGWSLGSGVATQMAVEHHPRALVLFAPFSSFADVFAPRYPWVPVRALLWDRFDNLAKIAAIDAPLLIAHGEADETVPAMMGRKLLNAAREPKRGLFLRDEGHWIEPRQALAGVAEFLDAVADAATAAR